MSSTQNVKGNHKIVVATFSRECVFKIPDGLDLEDETVVENYYSEKGILYIRYVNQDEEFEIEPEWHDDQVHTAVEIEDAVDKRVEYDEDCNDNLGRFISKKMDVLNEMINAGDCDWYLSDVLEWLHHDKEWVSENLPERINDTCTHCEECGKKNVLNEKINCDGRFYM